MSLHTAAQPESVNPFSLRSSTYTQHIRHFQSKKWTMTSPYVCLFYDFIASDEHTRMLAYTSKYTCHAYTHKHTNTHWPHRRTDKRRTWHTPSSPIRHSKHHICIPTHIEYASRTYLYSGVCAQGLVQSFSCHHHQYDNRPHIEYVHIIHAYIAGCVRRALHKAFAPSSPI